MARPTSLGSMCGVILSNWVPVDPPSFLSPSFSRPTSQNFKATLEFVFLSELVLVLSIDILFELIYRIEIFICQMWFTFL
jgi:hypothetical protein